MKKNLPKSDSIRKLAKFWDEHDLTDFANDLEEEPEPVFQGAAVPIPLRLRTEDARALKRIAESKGLSQRELVHRWIQQRLEMETNKRSRKAS